jgi:tape measure domain-containing protein
MTDNAADFFLRLKDQTSPAAASASKSVRRVIDSMRELDRATRTFENKAAKTAFERQHRIQTAQIRAARAMADHKAELAKKGSGGIFGDVFSGAALGSFAGGAAVAGLSAVAGLAKSAAMAVFELGQSFVASSVSAAAFGQDAKLAIGALLRDPAEAAKQFEEVRTEAQRLGTDVFGSVNQFRKLLSAQFDVSTARDIMRMTADLQVAGANVDKAVLAISQIKMKGFLQGEELTGQLAEAGVSAELVYKQLEKQLGKTRKEILTMQRTGQIKADVAIEAIFGAVKAKTGVAEFGELAEKRALQTLSGIYTKAKAATQNLFIDIGEVIGPVLIPIARRLGSFVEGIAQNESLKRIGANMLESLRGAASWVEENWDAISETLTTGLEYAAGAAQWLVVQGQELYANWDLLKQTFSDFIAPLRTTWMMFTAISDMIGLNVQRALALTRVLVNLRGLLTGGVLGFTSDVAESGTRVAMGEHDAGIVGSVRDAFRVFQGKGTAANPVLDPNFNQSAFEIPPSFQGAMPGGMNMMRMQGMGGGTTNNVGDIAVNVNVDASRVGGTPEEVGQAVGPEVAKQLDRMFRHQLGGRG